MADPEVVGIVYPLAAFKPLISVSFKVQADPEDPPSFYMYLV